MKTNAVIKLRCPRCGWYLEPAGKISAVQEEVSSGIVRCKCARYPIVAGILALKAADPNAINRALMALEAGDQDSALLALLETRTTIERIIQQAKLRRLLFSAQAEKIRQAILRRRLKKIVQAGYFLPALDLLGIGDYGSYFKYRFSATSMIAGMPLLLLAQDFPGPILEIGCGMGHLGFLLAQLYPGRQLVLTDSSFINLYFAKRFFVPQADYICLDANEMLPFAPESFNAVYSFDAFHYLDAKSLAAREISRVSAKRACVVLGHLHNRDKENPTPGNPLDAEGWLWLCGSPHAKLLPEEDIFRYFLNADKLDLSGSPAAQDIADADAFTLVASSSPETFRVYQGLREQLFLARGNIIINPLYGIFPDAHAAKTVLKKKWESGLIRKENSAIDKLLPDEVSLDKDTCAKIQAGKAGEIDQGEVVDLLRRFILINAPRDFRNSPLTCPYGRRA